MCQVMYFVCVCVAYVVYVCADVPHGQTCGEF